MSFSKNRARILPESGPEQAGNFAADALCTTIVANLCCKAGKAFAACWQKAKLQTIQCGFWAGTCHDFSARMSHAQSPLQCFVMFAAFRRCRSIRPGGGPVHPTPVLR
ncbi:hypothetical protein C1X30_22955 [Pseudomonas sp. FW305-BF6]|nr:hypothetical protein C1X28_23505 [Pseudomonas sp. FW305-BF15]PNB48187.1 hypothetical protein C1X29_19695 [Pseudomonas sp. GW456-12-10-14-LB2]PNB78481.1 hypothetical protein C1X30_22955 [Pseudomonas sp. FW305-BF6]TEA60160.1 hypothetical protein EIY71_19095 [Pseudomonas sp. CH235]